MSSHKSIDKICIIITVFTVIVAVVFCGFSAMGINTVRAIGYENRIFDRTKVHTIDIVMNDWESFIEGCESEEYSPCNVIIDGEAIKNVGIRAKGNTSLSSVKNSGSSRYSFKIEFDQYDKTKSYHGLDKLCLNNIIQDNTYMKDYLAYSLMYDFGVDAPLCSYAYITVNGEDWGLYLAVEAIEDSFLTRNYGSNYGDLYKPDSMSFGGGRGNGRDFSMTDFINENTDESDADKTTESSDSKNSVAFSPPSGSDGNMPDMSGFDPSTMPDMSGFDPSSMPDMSGFDPSSVPGGNGKMPDMGGGFGVFGGGMGSDDVKLKYIDDDPDSYSNIFGNAKTTVNTADKNRLIRSLKALSEKTDIGSVVDTDEVIRYFVVHDFLCNGDSYTGQMIHNYYLYEENGQLSMIPWDYNLAYGSFSGGNASSSVNSPIDTPVSNGMSDRPMVAWIFDSEEYTNKYHELFSEFLSGTDLDAMITETAAMIDEYVRKDPTKFCTYEEYQKGVEAIRKFCKLRTESVKGQLDGTIPSTSDGQKADSSALIDTSSLNVSDMGTMGGNGGGFGGFGGKTDSKSSENSDGSADSGQSDKFGGSSRRRTSNGFGRRGSSTESSQQDSAVSTTSSSAKTETNTQTPSSRQMPEGFDPTQMPEGFDRTQMPEGFDPTQIPSGQMPGGFDGQRPQIPGQDSAQSESSEQTSGESSEHTSGGAADRTSRAVPDKADTTGKSSRPSMGSFSGMSGAKKDDNATAYILTGISALVLLCGLVAAKLYKR